MSRPLTPARLGPILVLRFAVGAYDVATAAGVAILIDVAMLIEDLAKAVVKVPVENVVVVRTVTGSPCTPLFTKQNPQTQFSHPRGAETTTKPETTKDKKILTTDRRAPYPRQYPTR